MSAVTFNGGVTATLVLTEILFPPLTDIRGPFDGPIASEDDLVLMVPGGTLPFRVFDVYDVAKGFTNEYRIALVRKIPQWPIPIP